MLIYMATNRINGKQYVGQTVSSLKIRKTKHIREALAESCNSYYFQRAIKKYGQENFDWKILHEDVINIDNLNRLEIFYIGYYDTFKNGYNLTEGGGGKVGCIVSIETRKILARINKGKKHTKKSKLKMSMARRGKNNPMYGVRLCGKDNHMYGKHFSEEAKRKNSEAHMGKGKGKNNPAAKAIIADNIYFDTSREAAKFFGVSHTAIYKRLKKRLPGYRYVNKKEEE